MRGSSKEKPLDIGWKEDAGAGGGEGGEDEDTRGSGSPEEGETGNGSSAMERGVEASSAARRISVAEGT